MGQLRKTTMIDLDELKTAMHGRWPELFRALCGVPAEHLDTKGHPCPKCGGEDRWGLISAESGAMHCRKCSTKIGDGIAAVEWLNGVEFKEAVAQIADWCGVKPLPPNSRPQIDLIERLAVAKNCDRNCLVEFGAEADQDRKCVIFPMYGPDRKQCSTFTIWPMAEKGTKEHKGKCEYGKDSGMFFPFSDQGVHFPQPDEQWVLVEGVKDASAIMGLGYNAAGMNGDQLAQKFVELFRGVDLVIVPDRTPDAEEKAKLSAAKLHGVTKRVRVANLPLPINGSKGDDTRDALKQKGGADLVKKCIQYSVGPVIEGKPLKVTSLKQITFDRINQYSAGIPERVPFGIEKIDEVLDGGFDVGSFVLWAALSGHGKTMTALQHCHHLTTKRKTAVGFISTEMTLPQLGDRALDFISDASKAQRHYDNQRVSVEAEEFFENAADCTVVHGLILLEDVERGIRTCFDRGAEVVFVDYAGRIRTKANNDQNAAMQIVSSTLSGLAKEHGKTVVCLAQLNKRVAKDEKFSPQMHDIQYGTDLVNDADYVMFNCWPHKLDTKNPQDDYLITIKKNRNGDSDVGVWCKFDPRRQRLSDVKIPKRQSAIEVDDSSGVNFVDFS